MTAKTWRDLRWHDELGWWQGNLPIKWLKATATVTIEVESSGAPTPPSERQAALLTAIVERDEALHESLEAMLVEYYQDVILNGPEISDDDEDEDDDDDDTTPQLSRPADIWELLSHPRILIEADDGKSAHVRFQVAWDAEFDEDDGVGVWLSNFEFEVIGAEDDR